MTPSFEAHRTADRRLTVLLLLADSTGYSANEYTLVAVLSDMGQEVSNDKLHSELAWLQEQGLVSLTKVGGLTIAKLTTRGLDVARGRAVVPGVKRPDPD